jgi:alpha-beta hydrolase superfamily lysophospholipase
MPPPVDARSQPIETVGRWMGSEDRPLLSWLTTPEGGSGSVGVVIVPPFGYELWTSHWTLRTLAERLAAQGCSVVRFDFDGTGDSAGDQWDPDRLDRWRDDLGTAATSLRELGVSSLVVVGLRAGGTLALLEGSRVAADAVVAWAPVVRGRRYVRELQLLGLPVPEDPDRPEHKGAIAEAGSLFAAGTLDALSALDLSELPVAPAPRTLVIDRDDRPASTSLLDRLEELGAKPEHQVVGGTGLVLDQPTEYAVVAEDVVDRICSWVGPGAVLAHRPAPRPEVTFPWADGAVTETVVRLGRSGLIGVLTHPVGPSRATVVWLNSGSEHHVGPGRAWVEYARQLALDGYTSLRVDFSGWGESPDRGRAPGRPYDLHGIDEVAEVVEALRADGHRHVVVAGLCAGAWIALRAALTVRLDGVIALNPQLYWQPGDPVEADIVGETRARRQDEIRRIKALRSTGLWWSLDAAGLRHPAAVWLRSLARTGIPIMTLFADGDDGLEFLQDRTGRTWAEVRRQGGFDVVVVDQIDHPMHRHWHRSKVVSAVRSWLDRNVPPDRTAT